MAINKRRFSQEATYARRCLRGRSCARGRVVPCPAPQPGKVSGMGMQDRMPPRMRKKFPHQDSTLPTPGRFCLSYPLPGGRSGPQKLPRRPQGPPPPGRFCLPSPLPGGRSSPPGATGETTGATAAGPVCLSSPLPGGRSRPKEPPGRPLRPPPPGPVCTPPCQEAAAGPRSHQGDRKGLRRRAGLPVLSPARGPQQAPGAARETAGTSAAGPVTFNARRDYELLEQVVSTYGR